MGTKQENDNAMRLSVEEFNKRIKNLHGDNIIAIDKYINAKTKIRFKCVNGHIWSTKPNDMFMKHTGCRICSNKGKMTFKIFIDKLKNIHGNKYIPLEHNKHARHKIKMHCNTCGEEWLATPSHMINDKCGCPNCKIWRHENDIEIILNKNNIIFKKQYTFNQLKSKHKYYSFDFGILENTKLSYLIEYDGEQHYKAINFFGGKSGLRQRKKNDNIKNKYCKDNCIPLIRIPYTHKDICLEDLLLEKSKFIKEV